MFTTRLVRYCRESRVCPLFPMRIPISFPSKSTSRHPSEVLYSDLISTSPRSIEPNTSRRNVVALSSISLISAGSVMISMAFAGFTGFSLISFGSLTGFSLNFFSFGCFSFIGLTGFSAAGVSFDSALSEGTVTDFAAGF